MENINNIETIKTRVAGITFYNEGIDGTYRQSILEEMKKQGRLNVGQRLFLRAEKDNQFDQNAVQVLAPDGRQIGYIPRGNSEKVAGMLEKNMNYIVTISDIYGGSSDIGYRLNINIEFSTESTVKDEYPKQENEILKTVIQSIEVKGLFGTLDYLIDLNDDISILHAMNGAGKSTIFNMITGVINGDFGCFSSVPCKSFTIALTNNTKLKLSCANQSGDEYHIDQIAFDYSEDFLIPSDITYKKNEVIDLQNPITVRMIKHCTGGLRVKFVSANRLYELSKDVADGKERVVLCAKMIEEKVREAKELFTKYSETLYSSFLYRVMDDIHNHKPCLSFDECNQRRAELDAQRNEFAKFGLQNQQETHTVNSSYDVDADTSEDVLCMMTTFIKDSQTKNTTIIDVYNKIKLLIRMINEEHEFCRKKLVINFGEKNPIRVCGDNGQDIPLAKLSSGEKNDFILFSELIFDCDENTCVLIDEPEISLHPAWQLLIFDELMQIRDLNHIQIMVATHSPTIVNGHWDKAIALEAM